MPDVTPKSLPLSHLIDLLEGVEDAILGALSSTGGTDDKASQELHPVTLSLIQISKASTGLQFVATEPSVKPAFRQVAKAVKEAQAIKLPRRARDGLRRLQEFVQAHNQVLEFRVPENARPLAKLTPNTELFEAPAYISGDTEIYGKLERVGGAEPRITLRVSDTEVVRFAVTEELARSLAPHLYRWVGLVGEASWNPSDNAIETFRLHSVLPYEDTPISEAFGMVAEQTGEYWARVQDVVSEVRRIRSEDDE